MTGNSAIADWDKGTAALPATCPAAYLQRQYSRDQYPREVSGSMSFKQQYRYQPHEPAVRQYYQELGKGQGQGKRSGPRPGSGSQ